MPVITLDGESKEMDSADCVPLPPPFELGVPPQAARDKVRRANSSVSTMRVLIVRGNQGSSFHSRRSAASNG